WYRLLEICALTSTLVIDEEGVYDPGLYGDRLLLGFLGTMSEAELHWLRQRLLGGKLEKAQKGQLRFRLPAGLVYDAAGRVVRDPDEQVQAAVALVFDLFEHYGSALAVVKHFTEHQLLFPTRFWGGVRNGELQWQRLRSGRVLAMLHNPAYAGAYVYGRTKTRTQLLPGEAPRIKGRTRQVKPEHWPIVLQEVYPGYISWAQFLHNQQQLDDNRTFRAEERRGAIREGAALLQGIVLCGRCGRRMSVRYMGERATVYYECNEAHTQLASKTCQSLRGDHLDTAVAEVFLEAMQPAQLEVSMAALEHLEARARQVERQWQLRLERARYEVDLARRRYSSVDPENRLVARTLERDWNEKLAEAERLEHDYASLPRAAASLLSDEQRQRALRLAQDLPQLWHAQTTTQVERKQLLRFLIKDVTLTRRETSIHLGIRWQTEALTEMELMRPKPIFEAKRTDPAVVERVRELACSYTDGQIAQLLNEAGLVPGMGGSFSKAKIQWIRYAYRIASACPQAPGQCTNGQRGDGRYSAKAAADLLNVNVSTISAWCHSGQLDGVQESAHGPWWVRLTPDQIEVLRKPARRRWKKNSEK
ncbi:MAG TPA: recombinase family protein, partial [Rhodothermales bacterium]|nr:recombinase family protein [Rhodothermales bacterium]